MKLAILLPLILFAGCGVKSPNDNINAQLREWSIELLSLVGRYRNEVRQSLGSPDIETARIMMYQVSNYVATLDIGTDNLVKQYHLEQMAEQCNLQEYYDEYRNRKIP